MRSHQSAPSHLHTRGCVVVYRVLPSFQAPMEASFAYTESRWVLLGFTEFRPLMKLSFAYPRLLLQIGSISFAYSWLPSGLPSFTEFPTPDETLICISASSGWLLVLFFLFVFFLPSPCWEIDIGFLLIWLGVDRIDMNKTFNLIELARWIRRLNRIVVETAQTKPITEADSIQRWNHGIQLCCIDRKTLKSIALSITKPKDKTREN